MVMLQNTAETPPRPANDQFTAAPQLALPKGGGAISGIGETFSANPVTGTGALSVPITTSPGRSGFGPKLTLSYDSGSGNGPFGLGWTLALPSISRRTDRGLPRYQDAEDSDVFILSGAEDLVPAMVQDAHGNWQRDTLARDGYQVARYRPRIEGLFSVIERWTSQADGDAFWRSISKDNVTTWYGKTAASRVADPGDPARVFSWLICQSQDDKGNVIIYEYAAENFANVDRSQANERNRTDQSRSANRYLKRIKYGNTPSLLIEPDVANLSWLFETVFDYDERHYAAQAPDFSGRVFATAATAPAQPWTARADPFSRYRSCFEVRTYRLCRRVLMFHHFHHFAPELGVQDYLVRATEFTYLENPVATQLTGVVLSGFVLQGDGSYLRGALPPLQFEYSEAHVHKAVRDVDPASLGNLPASLDGLRYRWLDLDGEGLQGVLAEQDDAWYYKRNLSPLSLGVDAGQSAAGAKFEVLTEVARLPALAEAGSAAHQFMDLARTGHLDCVVFERPGAGFYRRTAGRSWAPFQSFAAAPNIDWNDPNLRLIDLDGDGLSDILITEHEVLTYYASCADAGFAKPVRVPKATDEEAGPAIVFADSTQSIFLADMSGDGLADIVRVRNGEICYWPNLGYGEFGCKVAMDRAPWFDAPDLFDPRRIRLADVDGSGVADLVYLADDGVRLHFNQAGNAWSSPDQVMNYPPVENLAAIQVLDLLGNGTSCLVWTSSAFGDAGHSMRYIDLMGGQKPYLLVRSWNNLGAETRVSYVPSTAFYLADREAGRPWATRLPFPVQVVERVEICDWVSRNRFVTRYAYHHGYYDGIEREFRGFGMVEQRDTEELGVLSAGGAFPDATNIDAASYVPPVLTKTWFHTGAYPAGARVSRIYASEYWQEPGLGAAQLAALQLPDSQLPGDLSGDEIHEAIRSLKGAMLRQEVYALDGTAAAGRPYTVSERNYTIRRLQPFAGNRHAVFFTHPCESIDFHYERAVYQVNGNTLADPRVTHRMTLAVDEYGNEVQSAAIAYGRRHDDPDPLLTCDDRAIQRTLHVTCTQRTHTNAILEPDAYRPPLPAETSTYELIKVSPAAALADVTNLFSFNELTTKIAAATDLPYEDIYAAGATQNHPYRRLIERVRMLYRKDDLSAALRLGGVESLALPFAAYKLALTPGLVALYRRGAENLLPTPAAVLRDQGGYVLSDDQIALGLFPATDQPGCWWVPSGQVFHSGNAADTPAQELAAARSQYFLPQRFRDPFGNDTTATYDAYALLLTGVRDPAQNVIAARGDYRVLQPSLLTDPNGNRSAAAFDALGLLAGTAVMGKASESLGDTLDGFAADLTQAQIDQFFADPKGPAAGALLSGATSRIIYDIGRFARAPSTTAAPLPVYAARVARETHGSDLAQGQTSKLQVSFGYSDGLGREIQRKVQAESGTPGWIASGWTIFNNKDKPVRNYEPFFDNTNDFKFGITAGVSPILFYDPLGRAIAAVHPDHSWEKVVFDPWRDKTWDRNDTVLIADPNPDADAGAFFARLPDADYLPTWYGQNATGGADQQDAAQKASLCAATPTTAFFESLGRTFLTVTYNRTPSGNGPPLEDRDRTSVEVDIEGNQRSTADALARKVMAYDYDMIGSRIRQTSVDAGERWMLNDASGKPLLGWDSLNRRIRHDYDVRRRPSNLYLQTDANPEIVAERIVYGEGQANDQALNLRTKVYQFFDGAGLVTSGRYDFKGNPQTSMRQLLQDYKDQVDWSQSPPLETRGGYTVSTAYDALNRPINLTTPDASVISPLYNERSLLSAVGANLRGSAALTQFVTAIAYNAKGQRESIDYANGASTVYAYDTNTFRLTHLTTSRNTDKAVLQDLLYTYDPIGNITQSPTVLSRRFTSTTRS
jgi:Salmonella virulence plasmid 65kDa B protein/Insecticide toxin TcdB middle/C-terminal region/Insecticide toxin TcdB middle/N-terminal region